MAAENKSTRIIPHDFEAEQAVLGAIIFNNQTMLDVAGILTPNSFHEESHRHIYRAMLELTENNQPIDEIIIGDQLKEFGKLEDIGGYAYLAELVDCVPSSGNIIYYAKIIQEHAVLRDLITTTSDISRKARDPQESTKDLLNEAVEKITSFTVDESEPEHIKDILIRSFDRLEHISSHKGEITGVPTGFIDCDKMMSGLQPTDLIILAARPSMGKGLSLEEPVLMHDGTWKKNKELSVGDKLASVDGGDNFVTGVFKKTNMDFYRIFFKDGRTIDCDSDHLWEVRSSRWRGRQRVLNILELKNKINLVRYKNRIYTTPIGGEFGNIDDIGINPWILGVLLGDGNFTDSNIRVSNSEDYIIKKIKNLTKSFLKKIGSSSCDYRFTNNRKKTVEKEFIKKTGLDGKKSCQKFIPDLVFRSNKKIRGAVLAGLLETDGWVEKQGAFRFSSSSEKLRDGVASLVYSLGGSAFKTVRKNIRYWYKGSKKNGLDAYMLTINLPDISIIQSPRIISRLKQRVLPYPKVSKIEYIGKKESQCISVSHKSKLYCAGDYIMTHNTALALNIASHVAIKHPEMGAVVFFSIEMSKEQLALRLLSAEAGIDNKKFKSGNFEQEDWDKLAKATDMLSTSNLIIDDRSRITPFDIISKTKYYDKKLKNGVGLVIVDYLQLMEGDKRETRDQQLGAITRSLKGYAKEMNIPIIALSQLNRALENRSDKRPQLSDLRESGSIEQDADIIIFAYRDEVYNEDTEKRGIAEMIFGKHRNGPTGVVELVFQGKYTRFYNMSKIEQPRLTTNNPPHWEDK